MERLEKQVHRHNLVNGLLGGYCMARLLANSLGDVQHSLYSTPRTQRSETSLLKPDTDYGSSRSHHFGERDRALTWKTTCSPPLFPAINFRERGFSVPTIQCATCSYAWLWTVRTLSYSVISAQLILVLQSISRMKGYVSARLVTPGSRKTDAATM